MQNVGQSENRNIDKVNVQLDVVKSSTPLSSASSPAKSETETYSGAPAKYMTDSSESEDDSVSEAEMEEEATGGAELSKFPSQEESERVDPEMQARLKAVLEAAGIGKLSGEGKHLADPEVLRRLTSTVSCALDEAAAALTRMRIDQPRAPPRPPPQPDKPAEPTSFTTAPAAPPPVPEGAPSLAEACSDGDVGTVRKLLTEGRSVHETTEEGESLLSLACSAGYYELAQVLLAMHASVEDRGIKGDCTPLMEAASAGHADIVRLLIAHGADVNAVSMSGNTSLMYACSGGHEACVRALLEHGANVEDHNENGHTPLMEAASAGHVAVARVLLERGAGINTHSNEFKESALTLACYKGHLDMVRFLLAAGADREHKTDEMHTALMEASMDGHVEVARLLLDSGAQVNMPTDSFESPLTLAACGGHVELAMLLLERGANIEEVNDEGYTPLMEAAREGHEEMVALLLGQGAAINAQTDETQETALTLACCGGFLEVADFLLKAGADVELGASTPLMEAAQEGHLDLVRYLLTAGARVSAQTQTGDTALAYACENGHTDVADLLLRSGAQLEHESEGGRTPIMKACRAGHLCTVQYLVGWGADINRTTASGDHTPLSLACAGGHADVVKFLLTYEADPFRKLKDNSTMLIEAAKGGHTAVVQMLLDYPRSLLVDRNTQPGPIPGTPGVPVPPVPNVPGALPTVPTPLPSVPSAIPSALSGYLPPDALALDTSLPVPDLFPTLPSPLPTMPSPSLNTGLLSSVTSPSIPVSTVPALVASQANPIPSLEDSALLPDTDPMLGDPSSALVPNVPPSQLRTALAHQLGIPHEHMDNNYVRSYVRGFNIVRELETKRTGVPYEMLPMPPMPPLPALSPCHGVAKRARKQRAAPPQADHHLPPTMKVPGSGRLCVVEYVNSQAKGESQDPTETTQWTELSPEQRREILSRAITPPPQDLADPDGATTPGYPPQQAFLTPVTQQQIAELHQQQQLLQQQHQQLALQAAQQCLESHLPLYEADQPRPADTYPAQGEESAEDSRELSAVLAYLQQEVPTLDTMPRHELRSLVLRVMQQKNKWPEDPEDGVEWSGPQPEPRTNPDGTACQQYRLRPPSPLPAPVQDPSHLTQFMLPLSYEDAYGPTGYSPPHMPVPQPGQPTQLPQSPQLPNIPTPVTQLQPLPFPLSQSQSQQTSTQIHSQPQLQLQQQHLQLQQQQLQQPQQQLQQQQLQQPLPPPTQPQPPPPQPTKRDQSVNTTNFKKKRVVRRNATTAPAPSPAPAAPVAYSAMDVDGETDSNHDTALTLACAGGHADLVDLLLEHGADIEHRDKKGFTPLILAATAGHEKIVDILVGHGADIEAQSERTKDTPLSLACSGGRYDAVELLLARGANREHRNVSDYTPLSLAASGGYVNIIRLLLHHQAEINSRTGSKLGISPLMLAAMNGHTAAVRLLLDCGSDINAQIETNRNTALTLACFQGRHEVVSLLLDRKANVEHRAKTGLTPLMEAASGGYVEVGRVLLDKGADVNAPPVPSSRDTALTIAADKGHTKFVELLLQRKAAVEVKNKKGNSPLWLAANGGHLAVVEMLYAAGADIDSQDNRKVSCLMAAFRKGHTKLVKWMVGDVTQFPSDQEMTRYICTISDKELLQKCQECVRVIRAAKETQAARANQNANILLEELDAERCREESRRLAAMRRKERKKKKKMEKKVEEKRKLQEDNDKNSMYSEKGSNEGEECSETGEDPGARREEGDSGIDANSQGSCSSSDVKIPPAPTAKSKKKKKDAAPAATAPNKKQPDKTKSKLDSKPDPEKIEQKEKENVAPVELAVVATTSPTGTPVAIVVDKKNDKKEKKAEEDVNKVATVPPVSKPNPIRKSLVFDSSRLTVADDFDDKNKKITHQWEIDNKSTSPKVGCVGGRRDEGWKEVVRKSSVQTLSTVEPGCKKVSVASHAISRVIGRAGTNINAIRSATGAHIEVDKQNKGQGERIITIKGSAEATKQAAALIAAMIRDPEADIIQLLPRTKMAAPAPAPLQPKPPKQPAAKFVPLQQVVPPPPMPVLRPPPVRAVCKPAPRAPPPRLQPQPEKRPMDPRTSLMSSVLGAHSTVLGVHTTSVLGSCAPSNKPVSYTGAIVRGNTFAAKLSATPAVTADVRLTQAISSSLSSVVSSVRSTLSSPLSLPTPAPEDSPAHMQLSPEGSSSWTLEDIPTSHATALHINTTPQSSAASNTTHASAVSAEYSLFKDAQHAGMWGDHHHDPSPPPLQVDASKAPGYRGAAPACSPCSRASSHGSTPPPAYEPPRGANVNNLDMSGLSRNGPMYQDNSRNGHMMQVPMSTGVGMSYSVEGVSRLNPRAPDYTARPHHLHKPNAQLFGGAGVPGVSRVPGVSGAGSLGTLLLSYPQPHKPQHYHQPLLDRSVGGVGSVGAVGPAGSVGGTAWTEDEERKPRPIGTERAWKMSDWGLSHDRYQVVPTGLEQYSAAPGAPPPAKLMTLPPYLPPQDTAWEQHADPQQQWSKWTH